MGSRLQQLEELVASLREGMGSLRDNTMEKLAHLELLVTQSPANQPLTEVTDEMERLLGADWEERICDKLSLSLKAQCDSFGAAMQTSLTRCYDMTASAIDSGDRLQVQVDLLEQRMSSPPPSGTAVTASEATTESSLEVRVRCLLGDPPALPFLEDMVEPMFRTLGVQIKPRSPTQRKVLIETFRGNAKSGVEQYGDQQHWANMYEILRRLCMEYSVG